MVVGRLCSLVVVVVSESSQLWLQCDYGDFKLKLLSFKLPTAFFLQMAVEARKFYLIKSEYLKECIKTSRSPAISRTIETPETSNTSDSQLKNNLGFLVRLLFEIMEGMY